MSWYVLSYSYKTFAFTTAGMTGVSQVVLLSLILRLVIQLLSLILTRHSQFFGLGSLHPRRIISPLRATSQPVLMEVHFESCVIKELQWRGGCWLQCQGYCGPCVRLVEVSEEAGPLHVWCACLYCPVGSHLCPGLCVCWLKQGLWI